MNDTAQTNKDIVAQISYATLAGDIVLTSAYAHELPRYGLKGGLTNYAAGMYTCFILSYRSADFLIVHTFIARC